MYAAYFEGSKHEEGDRSLTAVDADGKPCGVAYYRPVPVTEGTYELLMIAVQPDMHGRGIGKALLQGMELDLVANGHRLVLIQTQGDESFFGQRLFYMKSGYEIEARVRDYYSAGTDMVMLRKTISVPTENSTENSTESK